MPALSRPTSRGTSAAVLITGGIPPVIDAARLLRGFEFWESPDLGLGRRSGGRPDQMGYVTSWDGKTGEFHRVEGPRGFDRYREAVEASRFLRPTRELKTPQADPGALRKDG